ncbi:MAG: ABC transporter ATP-binding protein [candidate division WOR-3 bacterium]|nr:ABC transporter ATP-binding protein [candidate division WOR-3 bacterium]MCX7757896.1 ABC transporter ATP-binding protein [candidate division WOR-3 bacterium]MDW7987351.1 ABC transporter ATP-binding protein [candidate division WOR-3 bacterium]
MGYAIEVNNVIKKFKRGSGLKKREIVAVNNATFEINEGEIFGLLGPNGAGKTTLVRCIATLLIPDSGTIKIMGKDVLKYPLFCRRQIGLLTSGERTLYWKLSAKDNLKFFAALYGLDKKETEKRIDYLMELLGLKEVQNERVEKYSSGMKQKVSLARALIHDPKVLLLDEPTLGLDPQFARFLRDFIKNVLNRQERKTILLTTHYMDEADELCSRIAFINQGRIVDCKTPEEYKRDLPHSEVLEIKTTLITNAKELEENLSKIPTIEKVNITTQNTITHFKIILPRAEQVLSDVISEVQKYAKILAIDVNEPTLEDVFIYITGRRLTEDTKEELELE